MSTKRRKIAWHPLAASMVALAAVLEVEMGKPMKLAASRTWLKRTTICVAVFGGLFACTAGATAADFNMKFDSAVIQAGWRAQTPGVNHRNDVAPEPDDVVVFSGSNDDGEIHIPAEGVAIAHETATVKPFFSVFRIEWKATGPFTGTFNAATGQLDLSGTLEQTIREGSNVCTTGPINIKLSTEGSPYGNSNEGVRFVDGLEGAGTLTGSGELPVLIGQTRGVACDKEALSCYARTSITGRSLTAAFATSGPVKRAVASLEICDPPTVVDPPKTPTPKPRVDLTRWGVMRLPKSNVISFFQVSCPKTHCRIVSTKSVVKVKGRRYRSKLKIDRGRLWPNAIATGNLYVAPNARKHLTRDVKSGFARVRIAIRSEDEDIGLFKKSVAIGLTR